MSVNVFATSQLRKWLRCSGIKGEDAALLLSDVIPETIVFDESGHMSYAETFCKIPSQLSTVFASRKTADSNPPTRLEVSFEEKIDLMRQDFEAGESMIYSSTDWVEWAIDKNFKINWLEYALTDGFFPLILNRISGNEMLRKQYMPLSNCENCTIGGGIEGASVPLPQEVTQNVRAHVSNSLAILNQAAARFWANADKDDRSTHPKKSDVVAWLIEHGFSQITAESGATIIRPEWAPTGRVAQQ